MFHGRFIRCLEIVNFIGHFKYLTSRIPIYVKCIEEEEEEEDILSNYPNETITYLCAWPPFPNFSDCPPKAL